MQGTEALVPTVMHSIFLYQELLYQGLRQTEDHQSAFRGFRRCGRWFGGGMVGGKDCNKIKSSFHLPGSVKESYPPLTINHRVTNSVGEVEAWQWFQRWLTVGFLPSSALGGNLKDFITAIFILSSILLWKDGLCHRALSLPRNLSYPSLLSLEGENEGMLRACIFPLHQCSFTVGHLLNHLSERPVSLVSRK